MAAPKARPWREERVIIVFRPRLGKPESLKDRPDAGDWLVVPGNKVLSPDQEVTWQTVPPVQLELFLPGVFTNTAPKGHGTVTAKVKPGATIGFYYYEAYCDGQLATAGSAPSVIIDP